MAKFKVVLSRALYEYTDVLIEAASEAEASEAALAAVEIGPLGNTARWETTGDSADVGEPTVLSVEEEG